MFQIVEVKLQTAQHLLHGVGVSILLNHANIFCSFSRFISKNKQKKVETFGVLAENAYFCPRIKYIHYDNNIE